MNHFPDGGGTELHAKLYFLYCACGVLYAALPRGSNKCAPYCWRASNDVVVSYLYVELAVYLCWLWRWSDWNLLQYRVWHWERHMLSKVPGPSSKTLYFHRTNLEGRKEGRWKCTKSGHGMRLCREWHRCHRANLASGPHFCTCCEEGRKEGRWKCTKRSWNETLSRLTPLQEYNILFSVRSCLHSY